MLRPPLGFEFFSNIWLDLTTYRGREADVKYSKFFFYFFFKFSYYSKFYERLEAFGEDENVKEF